jgi:hypothetical protein
LGSLRGFRAPGPESLATFFTGQRALVAEFAQMAAGWDEEGLKAASTYAEAAGKIFATVRAGTEALTGLATFQRPTDHAIGEFKFATEHLVRSLAESAEVMDVDFVDGRGRVGRSGRTCLGILADGVAGLSALLTFQRPTDYAIGEFKFATEHLVRSLAESAQVMDADFVAAGAEWATAAGACLAILKTGDRRAVGAPRFRPASDFIIGEFSSPRAPGPLLRRQRRLDDDRIHRRGGPLRRGGRGRDRDPEARTRGVRAPPRLHSPERLHHRRIQIRGRASGPFLRRFGS